MQGRYGTDQFSRFLLGAAVVCLVLSLFIHSGIWSFLILLLIVYCYFRMFSRNIQKRYAGKSEIPADDGGNPQKMGHMEAGYDGAQNASYL